MREHAPLRGKHHQGLALGQFRQVGVQFLVESSQVLARAQRLRSNVRAGIPDDVVELLECQGRLFGEGRSHALELAPACPQLVLAQQPQGQDAPPDQGQGEGQAGGDNEGLGPGRFHQGSHFPHRAVTPLAPLLRSVKADEPAGQHPLLRMNHFQVISQEAPDSLSFFLSCVVDKRPPSHS